MLALIFKWPPSELGELDAPMLSFWMKRAIGASKHVTI
jgi:hypothetical protein